ncbi:MAG: hypothetical protein IJY24_01090 [Clostridia bacterium]|nr:hypothetical protein [Clostridia bacterium]
MMKKYEAPVLVLLAIEERDVITCSFGNLEDLPLGGTNTPNIGFGW